MPLANQETNKSVSAYINSIENEQRKKDAKVILKMMKEITGKKPKVWGDNFFIGFGKYKYKRKGGKEEFEFFNVGFAPRKSNLTLYFTCDIKKEKDLLKKLGKHKTGAGCLYINKLDDVDLDILKKLITKNKNNKWTNN